VTVKGKVSCREGNSQSFISQPPGIHSPIIQLSPIQFTMFAAKSLVIPSALTLKRVLVHFPRQYISLQISLLLLLRGVRLIPFRRRHRNEGQFCQLFTFRTQRLCRILKSPKMLSISVSAGNWRILLTNPGIRKYLECGKKKKSDQPKRDTSNPGPPRSRHRMNVHVYPRQTKRIN